MIKTYSYKISKPGISLKVTLNIFKCLIPSSTKILTMATSPFLFIFVGVLCVCLSVNLLWCQLCKFYCPLRKKRFTLLPEGTDVHIQQYIHQKDLNLCVPRYYHDKVIVELEKTQTRNSNVFVVLVI